MSTLLIGLGIAAVVLLLLESERFPIVQRVMSFLQLVLMRGFFLVIGLLIIPVALAIGGAAVGGGVDSKSPLIVAAGALIGFFGVVAGGMLIWAMWTERP